MADQVYRGYIIRQLDDHTFQIVGTYIKCNTAWSCIASIDELLSP